MAFTRKLKQMMMFNDGDAYVGDTVSITPPKLTRKFEEHRAGGMNRPVKIDMGGEALELEATYAGFMRGVLLQHGMMSIGGVQQRFVGSFQDDESGLVSQVEIVTRGRHDEIDMGEWKPGDSSEFKVKSQLSYYKLSLDSDVLIEIDVIGMVEIVGGVDLMAAHRAVLGL
ncbi:phage major tail tube protein [uncultured Sphingomonas sp.]|uniref:phage major tail tube protein n=1 Tax=uncultured Sphingomonas sp. TaxID=158754 RepID=UPI0025CEA31B|nr:phage major tail tube protein [uncultured Sphingomonas sp.]